MALSYIFYRVQTLEINKDRSIEVVTNQTKGMDEIGIIKTKTLPGSWPSEVAQNQAAAHGIPHSICFTSNNITPEIQELFRHS